MTEEEEKYLKENKDNILSSKGNFMSYISQTIEMGTATIWGEVDAYEHCDILFDEFIENKVKDKNLRVLAEFDNYKKRTNKEISEIKERTKFDTLSKFIDILDDWKFFEDVVQDSNNNDIKTGFNLIDKKVSSFLK